MSSPAPAPPLCVALVLADMINRDPRNGKIYILGTFETLHFPNLPAVAPSICVYCALTDSYRNVRISVKLECPGSEEEEGEVRELAHTELQFSDPRAMAEHAFTIKNVRFDKVGEHRLQIFSNNEFLTERRIRVRLF